MTGEMIEGSVRDKGVFGGWIRGFLLSDRWFSWDFDLSADINLVSITALAERVKTFITSKAELPPMPEAPELIKKIEWLERAKPQKPIKSPAEPTNLPAPSKPEGAWWYVSFSWDLFGPEIWGNRCARTY